MSFKCAFSRLHPGDVYAYSFDRTCHICLIAKPACTECDKVGSEVLICDECPTKLEASDAGMRQCTTCPNRQKPSQFLRCHDCVCKLVEDLRNEHTLNNRLCEEVEELRKRESEGRLADVFNG